MITLFGCFALSSGRRFIATVVSKKQLKVSTMVVACVLGVIFTLSTGRTTFADSKNECGWRLEADRARMDRDAEKHGVRSRQVDADLKRMDDDRNWCRHHRAEWDHTCFDVGANGIIRRDSSAPTAVSAVEQARVGGRFEPASLVITVPPEYPDIARTAHVYGTVALHAVVGKEGRVQTVEYVSGPTLLMRSALDAVKQWRYKPALLNCKEVEMSITIAVMFNSAPAVEGPATSP